MRLAVSAVTVAAGGAAPGGATRGTRRLPLAGGRGGGPGHSLGPRMQGPEPGGAPRRRGGDGARGPPGPPGTPPGWYHARPAASTAPGACARAPALGGAGGLWYIGGVEGAGGQRPPIA